MTDVAGFFRNDVVAERGCFFLVLNFISYISVLTQTICCV